MTNSSGATCGFAAPKFTDDEELAGKTPRFAPKHNVNLWLRKDFRGGLNAAFGFRHLSEQFTDDANEQTLDSYGIAAAAVGYRTPRWDWTVNIDNLFNNEDYFTPGHFSNNAFPGQPFNVTTTIRLKWN